MAVRSRKVSPEKIKVVKQALSNLGITQEKFRERLGYSYSTISNFLNGKPVDQENFFRICEALKLDALEVSCQDYEIEVTDIDLLVQEVRQKIKPFILERCEKLRVLNMNRPVQLKDVYIPIKILEKVTADRRRKIESFNLDNIESLAMYIADKGISEQSILDNLSKDNYSKLIIFGKPGSGKTSFLRQLAVECIEEKSKFELIPVFISIKQFIEAIDNPDLLGFINSKTQNYKVTNEQVKELLQDGKLLVLLDGLDEVVKKENQKRVRKEIENFVENFPKNYFIITTRIGALEYNFDNFTEVEIADLDDEQIKEFATKWFKNKSVKATDFIKQTNQNSNKRIKELATNPLLLTLLCVVFEELETFPTNRSELYKEALDILLKQWDEEQGIERRKIYKNLLIKNKEDLLSKIAFYTFESCNYFFKQEVAEHYILEYLRNLPNANQDLKELEIDSEAVLKSIEAQHGLLVERAKGIYSFSHLSFHEYLTAKKIIDVKKSSEEALQDLVSHLTESRWQEVFLLVAEMSPNPNRLLLLMKEQIDALMSNDENLQYLLNYVYQKSTPIKTSNKPAVIRAFNLPVNPERYSKIDTNTSDPFQNNEFFEYSSPPEEDNLVDIFLKEALYLVMETTLEIEIQLLLEPDFYNTLYKSLDAPGNSFLELDLKTGAQSIMGRIPDKNNWDEYKAWWRKNGIDFVNDLRKWIAEFYNMDNIYKFSPKQKDLFNNYIKANVLLIKCLKTDCSVSPEVRQYIEDTLLLPISEIENYPKPEL